MNWNREFPLAFLRVPKIRIWPLSNQEPTITQPFSFFLLPFSPPSFCFVLARQKTTEKWPYLSWRTKIYALEMVSCSKKESHFCPKTMNILFASLWSQLRGVCVFGGPPWKKSLLPPTKKVHLAWFDIHRSIFFHGLHSSGTSTWNAQKGHYHYVALRLGFIIIINTVAVTDCIGA